MENYELKYRKNVKTNNNSLTFSNYQNSTASDDINTFENEKTTAANDLSSETLMKTNYADS